MIYPQSWMVKLCFTVQPINHPITIQMLPGFAHSNWSGASVLQNNSWLKRGITLCVVDQRSVEVGSGLTGIPKGAWDTAQMHPGTWRVWRPYFWSLITLEPKGPATNELFLFLNNPLIRSERWWQDRLACPLRQFYLSSRPVSCMHSKHPQGEPSSCDLQMNSRISQIL